MYIFILWRHPFSVELLLWTLSALIGGVFASTQVSAYLTRYREIRASGVNGALRVVGKANLRREVNRLLEQCLFLFIAVYATLTTTLPKGFTVKMLPKPTVRGQVFAYSLLLAAFLVSVNTFYDRRDRLRTGRELEKRD